MPKLCNLSRGKMCYIILALSIIFFLSSVCTFAVLAMTKESAVKIKKNKNTEPYMQQQEKIIKRLKRIEKKVKTRGDINVE
jgi:preprotein translocase subunit SecY